ncbi:Stem cell self-renewal protein Piwi domain-containing protein [Planctomycetales bacterium 10988]|nr:Stem cell self-renewal protein Piwi domain-containing protein [Planctomycetales bacterium 10988]
MKPFDTGFIRKYAIQNVQTHFFDVDGKSAESYRRAIHKALQAQTQQGLQFDMALVEIEESFHALRAEADPYLVAKAEFLSHQIPVQEFEFETTEIPDNRLHYVLNNMALASYAKLGGTPWLVQANQPIAHELVIGLGSASVGDGRLGDRERVVGITTVFRGDGNYCISNVSNAVPFENYETELLNSLRQTISRMSKSMNWQANDHVRLVFHAFKPFKNAEADAVKKLVGELGDYQAEYAFLHVVEQHPFILFDKQQDGVPAFDGTGNNKGVLTPERGRFLRLSNNEMLIVLTGPKELKQSKDGMPCPILLRLGRGSTFRDLPYLTRQVNTFARHSWRSFDNSPLPVTLMYSELIARLLGKLGTVSFWNPSLMIGKIGETRWFL